MTLREVSLVVQRMTGRPQEPVGHRRPSELARPDHPAPGAVVPPRLAALAQAHGGGVGEGAGERRKLHRIGGDARPLGAADSVHRARLLRRHDRLHHGALLQPGRDFRQAASLAVSARDIDMTQRPWYRSVSRERRAMLTPAVRVAAEVRPRLYGSRAGARPRPLVQGRPGSRHQRHRLDPHLRVSRMSGASFHERFQRPERPAGAERALRRQSSPGAGR